jgi:peptide/nickel transport system permease protein
MCSGMNSYFTRRCLYALPIAMAVTILCFLLVHLAPGDPIMALLPTDATPQMVAELRRDYGLDKSLPEQYLRWLWRVLHGDFGRSIANGRPVMSEIWMAMKNTLLLSLVSAVVGFTVGCTIGVLAGSFIGRWLDRIVVSFAVFGVSVPHYWLGMVLVIIFAVTLNVLPAVGAGPGSGGPFALDWNHIQYIVLPALTLSLIPASVIARNIRGHVAETYNQDFVVTLRGKGLRRLSILRHVIKNVAANGLAIMGLQLGYMLGGSILVETVFNWPGSGLLLSSAIFQRDIPVLQGTTLVLALIFVMINLAVDLAQAAIDPRIKRA